MNRKKILIINSVSLFPLVMASQDRVYKMAKRLAQDHTVDVAAIVTSSNELEMSKKNLNNCTNNFYPIFSLNFNKNKMLRKLIGAYWFLNYLLFGIPLRHFYWGHRKIIKQIKHIVDRNNYDIVQVEYCYSGNIFNIIPKDAYKIIDTHDVLFEKKEKEYNYIYGKKWSHFRKKEFNEYKKIEIDITRSTDIVISLSEHDKDVFESLAPNSKHILIPTGQDIGFYKNYPKKNRNKGPVILFYGGIGSKQNTEAFFRLYENIFPLVKSEIPEVRLLVLGRNPNKKILRLNEQPDIEVTGFVEDVRPFIAKSSIMILPMKLGAGFRSRVVEVMAMGVPVLGTHNALDSINFKNGSEGVIEDKDKSLANNAVRLLKNSSLLKEMSRAAEDFAEKNFNIEATYGKLSEFYSNLSKK